ncbi:WhiB family transcriptional regulator [Propionibacteriaceae bacterium Y2011]|uniref:WhiB family transcriptional regulator n=1 Tax=Microlunatus sp. Y2014 TaxID=3418488 RepID=UPI003B4E9488
MSATVESTAAPACAQATSLFQHPLLEEPPTSNAPAAERRQAAMLARRAEEVCATCPLMQNCLYDAVVKYDVDGFAAGTTRRQRNEIRASLGVTVAPEDFDTLAGVTARHRQVDHDEVVRLRNANPHESLEMLAQRLGCSLSTVKRHLRRARNETKVTPIRKPQTVSMRQVMEAFRRVVLPAAASQTRRAA